MIVYLDQIPYSHSILSIKGIGNITVAGLIGEVGDFRKFRTISEVMKLAGLDLFEVSSGIYKGKHHISAVKSHGIMHARYQKMLNNGTPKIKALIAVSRKLLRIIFALARDNAQYEKNYNRKHDFKLAA